MLWSPIGSRRKLKPQTDHFSKWVCAQRLLGVYESMHNRELLQQQNLFVKITLLFLKEGVVLHQIEAPTASLFSRKQGFGHAVRRYPKAKAKAKAKANTKAKAKAKAKATLTL